LERAIRAAEEPGCPFARNVLVAAEVLETSPGIDIKRRPLGKHLGKGKELL
jgi:hypothetical protein